MAARDRQASGIRAHATSAGGAGTALEHSDLPIPSDEPDPGALVATTDQVETLLATLRCLPDDLAEVVRLAWVRELTCAEVSALLGIPPRTVKSLVSRARRLLNDRLRRNDD